jgi:hypothetical protein
MFRQAVGRAEQCPFPHLAIPDFIEEAPAERLLSWFEDGAPWERQKGSFFDVYDFDFCKPAVPRAVEAFRSEVTLQALGEHMAMWFQVDLGPVVDIQAHRLPQGGFIDPHTDYSEREQTHRLILQVNRRLDRSAGGYLVFFADTDSLKMDQGDVVFASLHRSAVAFEIGEAAYHAVTEVRAGERYTLIYSFHALGGYEYGCR